MWFQAAECNAVNASLLLNLINNNFLTVIFLTENLPILNPCYPQNPKIYDPILVTLLKMLPHPAENPHKPLVREYPPPRPGGTGALMNKSGFITLTMSLFAFAFC